MRIRARLRGARSLLVSAGVVLLLGLLGLLAGQQALDRAQSVHAQERLTLQRTLGALVEQEAWLSAADLASAGGAGAWPDRPGSALTARLARTVTASRTARGGAVLLSADGLPLGTWAAGGVQLPRSDDPGWRPLRDAVAAGRLPVSGLLHGDRTPMTAVAVPVPLSDGRQGLLIGVTVSASGELHRYTQRVRGGGSGRGYVVDDRGLVLAGPSDSALGKPVPGVPLRLVHGRTSGTRTVDGLFVTWARAGTTGWTSLGTQSEEEFAGPTRRAARRAQGLVVALLLCAGTGLVVLHRKREQALERLALRDELTGLYNRRGWFSLAERELGRARATGSKRVLLFVDLDGLKQVNDVLGHRYGDSAIATAARVLSRAAGRHDLVGRLGGDEFVLLLGDQGDAGRARARLLEVVAAHNAGADSPFELRLSVGAEVSFPDSACSLDELVRRADACMYAHKSARPDRSAGVVRVPAPREAALVPAPQF